MNKEGTESGFYLARAIINNHKGNLEIDNNLEVETTAQINIFHLQEEIQEHERKNSDH